MTTLQAYTTKGETVQMPSVGSDDEDSFEVLNQPSPDPSLDPATEMSMLPPIAPLPIENLQLNVTNELLQISAQNFPPPSSRTSDYTILSSLMSKNNLSGEVSYQEIQKKVEELIKENDSLKNTLMQNNLNLKAQYDKIHTWQNEMHVMNEAHKNKLIEAKNRIDKLVEANVKLTEEVEKYKNIKEMQDDEMLSLKGQLKLKGSGEALAGSFKPDLTELEHAKKKVKDQEIQICGLQEDNANLVKDCCKLKEQILYDTQNREVFKSKLAQENVAAKEEANRQELMISNMRQHNEQLNCTNKNQELEIVALNGKIDELNEELRAANEKRHVVQEESVRNAEQLEKLQSELALRDEQICHLKTKVFAATKKKEMLILEMDNLKKELVDRPPTTWDPNLPELHSVTCQQLMNAQMVITQSELKVKELEKQLRESAEKNDIMFALEQQVEVYKNDFEAERMARSALKQEKDQLEEDLANLQRRNQQLQEEIEVAREHNFVYTPSASASRTPPKKAGYTCPKCDFGFNNYQALENHVHRCLDLDVC